MNSLFDAAGLAIVAFAEVLADGSTTLNPGPNAVPTANSGVTTTKTGTGQYTITLPAGKTQAEPRDLVFVTPKGPITSTPYSAKADNSQPVSGVDGSQPINVGIYGGSPLASFADADFSIVIMRTIIP